MGNNYYIGENLIQDFLFQLLITGQDIASEKLQEAILQSISFLLENSGVNNKDLVYLDYKIKKTNEYYKLIANNMITAIWFTGFFPDDVDKIFNKKEVIYDNIHFKYNSQTKKLKWQKKK